VLPKQGTLLLSHTYSPFCSGYSEDGGLLNYLSNLAQSVILPILASQEARITGISHWYPYRGVSLIRLLDKKPGGNKKPPWPSHSVKQDSKKLYGVLFALF
jgi:hypothetical protein